MRRTNSNITPYTFFCLFVCLFLLFFLISNSIFGVNVRVATPIYVFKVKSCLAISKDIKVILCRINNFSIVTSIYPKYHAHN